MSLSKYPPTSSASIVTSMPSSASDACSTDARSRLTDSVRTVRVKAWRTPFLVRMPSSPGVQPSSATIDLALSRSNWLNFSTPGS